MRTFLNSRLRSAIGVLLLGGTVPLTCLALTEKAPPPAPRPAPNPVPRVTKEEEPAPTAPTAPVRPGLQNSRADWDDALGEAAEPPRLPDTLEDQENTPIVLVGYKNAPLKFTLRSGGKDYPMTLDPNRSFSFSGKQPWTIRFQRAGNQTVEYRLKPAVYRFLPSGRGFDLHFVVDLMITDIPQAQFPPAPVNPLAHNLP